MTTETPAIPAEALPPEGGEDYAAQMISRAEGTKPAPKAPEQKTEEPPKPNEQQHDWEKRFKDLQAEFTKLKQGVAKPQEAKPNTAQINLALAEKAANDAATKAAGKDATDADKAAAWAADQALKAARAEAEKAPEQQQEEPEKQDDAELTEDARQAKEITDKAGLDWNEVNQTFAQTGALDEKHYESLAKIGIPKEMVDQYVAGQVALQQGSRAELLADAGGENGYKSMVAWATDNMSADEIATYNKIVTGRDAGATKLAIAGLKAKYEAANGSEPTLINGDTSSTSVVGFKTTSELKKAMADPRYESDADYRREVENKLRISKI